MTEAGIEPATFRFVAQHLNHCATAHFRAYFQNTVYLPHTTSEFRALAMLTTVKRVKICPILRLKVNRGMEPHVSMNDNYQVKSGKSLHNVKFHN